MKPSSALYRVPSATYRWQFNREFPFSAGRELVSYLHELGISDCYCSPAFTAPPDSNHGYDVCDFTKINPVLGSTEGWDALVGELHNKGMGLLLDFVPNHMGAIPETNRWWTDVLEFGRHSPYAEFFDIDWQPSHLPISDRLLLPILPDHYGRCLQKGEISLNYHQGHFRIGVGSTRLPLHPVSCRRLWLVVSQRYQGSGSEVLQQAVHLLPEKEETMKRGCVLEAQRLLRALDTETDIKTACEQVLQTYPAQGLYEMLEEQAYRLAYWYTGTRTANYRRFFDVDSLVALRMEDPEAFKATHELLLELIRKGQVTGLRLDHIDGLARPVEYLQRLQKSIAHDTGMDEPADARGFYVLVEKITMEGEPLPSHWPVAGTTGYEFAREVTRLLLDSAGEPEITRIYQEFTGNVQPVGPSVQAAKKLVMGLAMSKEINGLTLMLRRCAEQRPEFRDLLYEDLCGALRETIACLSVYRSYRTGGEPISPQDRKVVQDAIARARQANPELETLAWDFLQQLLIDEPELNPPASQLEERFITRFQQTTGGVMAKGFEDTVFFAYNRLIALNEVGGNPAAFGMTVEEFHALNAERLKSWPDMMLTTSTHDTKTSEDVRARLAAISELSAEWENFLKQAREINGPLKGKVGERLSPDGNEEYLLYQILAGSWPLEEFPVEARKEYLKRIQAYMTKALNEAKINTRWDRRNHTWEAAVKKFIERIILSPDPKFEEVFSAFAGKVAEIGAVNSLNQVLLKMTVPGVPDFYQGNELWQYILVDPDNRRQIDYDLRQRMIKEIQGKSSAALLADWRNGGIKMFLTQKVLRFRHEHRELFQRGTYEPLQCTGARADSCLAFARTLGEQTVIVLTVRISNRAGTFPVGEKWEETMVEIPALPGKKLRNLFTNEEHLGGPMKLADVFRELPFAVLVAIPQELP